MERLRCAGSHLGRCHDRSVDVLVEASVVRTGVRPPGAVGVLGAALENIEPVVPSIG